ncbi:MAG: insulinase family protein [Deltaproteobacteria bacterium]|nr:insulinase family protein [Deltaproteobacteria bacterium]
MSFERSAYGALVLTLALSLASALPGSADSTGRKGKAIPERPEQLSFPTLDFEIPQGDRYRHSIAGSTPAYVVEDHSLPLVNISVRIRSGSYLDPADKPGLAFLTSSLVRRGGTASKKAEDFDEEVEFLAANIGTASSNSHSQAFASCITQALDSCLELFFEMLREPRFQLSRLEVEKARLLEGLKQRNDDAGDILDREWDWLLLGEDYFVARKPTADQLTSIQPADLRDFHRRSWRPEGMVFTVSGDIDTKEILAKLEHYLSQWPEVAADLPAWPPSLPTKKPQPGLYYVDKDIPQGKVYIGHLMPQVTDWDNPDLAPLRVMNEILGAGGFSSRIVQRIRSDEGLAYSAGTNYSIEPLWPGSFFVSYQSKSSTVALAAKIALEEIDRIQREPVSPSELETAKNSLIQTFPRRFESANQIASTFAFDQYLGRSHDYWHKWRGQMAKITAADVQRVAQKYLDPSQFLMLVVGKWDDIAPGDKDARATMKEFFDGKGQPLPIRDPLTLQPQP